MRWRVFKLTEPEYEAHRQDYDGVCLDCGAWTSGGVEPDAEGYECEACGAHEVVGTEQALVLGHLHVSPRGDSDQPSRGNTLASGPDAGVPTAGLTVAGAIGTLDVLRKVARERVLGEVDDDAPMDVLLTIDGRAVTGFELVQRLPDHVLCVEPLLEDPIHAPGIRKLADVLRAIAASRGGGLISPGTEEVLDDAADVLDEVAAKLDRPLRLVRS